MDIGPQLPPHLCDKTTSDEVSNDDDQDEEMFGPTLPPCFKSSTIIGPYKPELTDQLEEKPSCEIHEDDTEEDDTEENEAIGPQLPTTNDEVVYLNRIREEIEARANIQKDELVGNKGPQKTEREEWMTELPPELGKNFGLGPRTFRNRNVDLGDRSVWTDKPSDKVKKQNTSDLKTKEQPKKSKKEVETEEYVSKHNKRFREKSLLDMHRKDQKKKKESEDSTEKERRPFDRDTDLGLTQMNAAKKKSLIKQSSNLNSKFQHSKDGSTYL